MVAISLYRGNLHRVPEVPRRWLMPQRTISVKDFHCLLHRRSVALSRQLPSSTSTSNPSPSPNNLGGASNRPGPSIERTDVGVCREGTSETVVTEEVNDKVEDPRVLASGEIPKKNVGDSNLIGDIKEKESVPVNSSAKTQLPPEKKPDEPLNVKSEITDKTEVSNDKEKRKKEMEEKLQVLTAKKHNLVEVLKKILNAEAELTRRSSTQGTATRPAVSLQVDATNDTGSMAKHPTPSVDTEANQAGDAEGGEADDAFNHNMLSQRLPRMSSTSPSSESLLGKPALSQLNPVSHPTRASLAATNGSPSPSRFAPQGQPSHLGNLPAVSVSGTNYVTSSPSPAASGGTSVFKDARQPSPWN